MIAHFKNTVNPAAKTNRRYAELQAVRGFFETSELRHSKHGNLFTGAVLLVAGYRVRKANALYQAAVKQVPAVVIAERIIQPAISPQERRIRFYMDDLMISRVQAEELVEVEELLALPLPVMAGGAR